MARYRYVVIMNEYTFIAETTKLVPMLCTTSMDVHGTKHLINDNGTNHLVHNLCEVDDRYNAAYASIGGGSWSPNVDTYDDVFYTGKDIENRNWEN